MAQYGTGSCGLFPFVNVLIYEFIKRSLALCGMMGHVSPSNRPGVEIWLQLATMQVNELDQTFLLGIF